MASKSRKYTLRFIWSRRNKMTLETRERAVRRERTTQFCARCRWSFNNRRQDSKFCSIACKQASYRGRLEAKAAAARAAAIAKVAEAERAREATRRAIDLACRLIGRGGRMGGHRRAVGGLFRLGTSGWRVCSWAPSCC